MREKVTSRANHPGYGCKTRRALPWAELAKSCCALARMAHVPVARLRCASRITSHQSRITPRPSQMRQFLIDIRRLETFVTSRHCSDSAPRETLRAEFAPRNG